MGIAHYFAFLLVVTPAVTTEYVIINTTHGSLRGFQETVLQKSLNVFLGIPYAKPPVGDMQFRRTEDLPSWGDTVKDALALKHSCLQPTESIFKEDLREDNATQSEDCLYLNIWIPRSANKVTTLVWIYGGAFSSGSINVPLYNGKYLAAINNVIVVSMNYRLGPYGFLYTGSDDAPGNQGLLDQVMALKWIHNNIETFGGDRENITIFGVSAGSVSVNHHLFSPLARDYFTNIIMESGSSLASWAISEKSTAMKEAYKLAGLIGCKPRTDKQLVNCFKEGNAQEIVLKQFRVLSRGIPFSPIVDGHFLPDHPEKMLQRGDVKNTSVILGVNKNEATLFLPFHASKYFNFANPTLTPNRTAFLAVLQLSTLIIGGGDTIKEVLIDHYEKSHVPVLRPSYLTLSSDLYGDLLFKCPNNDFASKYAALGNDVFMYSFEHRMAIARTPPWTGVMHTYEIEFVFGHPLVDSNGFSDTDKTISRDIMEFWTNFAKTGTPGTVHDNISWPLYDTYEEKYITLDETMATKQGLRHKECVLWLETIPLILANERKLAADNQCPTQAGMTSRFSTIVIFVTLTMFLELHTVE